MNRISYALYDARHALRRYTHPFAYLALRRALASRLRAIRNEQRMASAGRG